MTRTDIPTQTIECTCKHCAAFAERKGLAFPLRAEVNEKMAGAIATNARGRHSLVQKAHQPPFGRMDDMQAKFGPWVA
ncbi:hypothetical protein [Cellulomonas shaoxiangyii]|uniref:Uncharacterized protein n=1 Tax=Cellulomonas shaoxiangyii TaxID=2566013 RepID=A0A4P7SL90_9CELL|nr:hypothetical protein [Cellulomonas shaoxiangyii]QCB93323.1 hypothetical protein E5225_06925 [Cellulomonas shaoxiangyii]TGY79428.1 hypothetical protein E5226_15455 [Cellulomonas shaoxiangyii]